MKIALIYGGGNDLGRAYCIWLLAQELGWTATAYAQQHAWGPLDGSGFAAKPLNDFTNDTARQVDVIVAYQPRPDTLGAIIDIAQATHTPVIVDVDDPSWEGRYGFTRIQRARVALGKIRRRQSFLTPYRLRAKALSLPIINASPFVQDRWPGTLVPHVRRPVPETPLPPSDVLTIAFIGTPRRHKGIDELRNAVRVIDNAKLIITAPPPPDADRKESWVGTTSLQDGREILSHSHIAAVLQRDIPWSHQQFPVKVVDGMMAGRVVLGSDLPPIRWALGSTGILVPPGDPRALVRALRSARDNPSGLQDLARRARIEAEARFTPEVVAPVFASVVRDALV